MDSFPNLYFADSESAKLPWRVFLNSRNLFWYYQRQIPRVREHSVCTSKSKAIYDWPRNKVG